MFIPSDTSDSSDFEWIAGGFPCRDMIRERLISDNLTSHEPTILPLDFQTSQANIKSEILDDQPQTSDPLGCPISIIPAGQSTTTSQPDNHLTPVSMTKPSDNPTETRKEVERDKSVDFPIFEVFDTSDDNATTQETQPEETTTTGNDFKLRRSSRNVVPPQFYGKSLYIDIIDETDNQPGSAQNPISLDDNDRSGFTTVNINENSSEKPTPIFSIHTLENTAGSPNSSSTDSLSMSSTDQSLRDAVNNFDDFIDFDSKIFKAELEKCMEGDKS